jgi:hypothetical protein
MGDPAPPHRRTHGGTGAGVLALVKPLPPKAVAGRPGFTRAKRPRLRSPPADRWAVAQDHALAPSLLQRVTSPIRNSIEPLFALPGLLTLAHRLPLRLARAAFRGTCVAIVFVLWSPFLRKGVHIAVKALSKPVDYQWSSWPSSVLGHQGLDRAVSLMVWLCNQLAWCWIVSVLLAVLGALVLSSELLSAILDSKSEGGVRAGPPSPTRNSIEMGRAP